MPIAKHSHTTEAQGGKLTAQDVLRGVGDLSGFGDGSDSDVTVSTAVNLTRTMFYDTLTVAASGELDARGYEIYARTRVIVESTGLIHSNGQDASGVTGGGTLANGEVDGRQAGGDGGADAVGSAGTAGSEGGAGGAGGAATAAGGAGGAAGVDSTSQVRTRSPGATVVETGGGGGGGGGDATPGTGGGGGASGGECSIHAPDIRVETGGTISANGGAGAAGVAANGGGGGSGGGGKVRLVYRTLTEDGTIEALAGTVGAGEGTGAVGVVGDAGIVEEVVA